MTGLRPIQCVCTNLKMAARAVGRAYDAALEPTGVNVVQYSILVNVSRYQPIEQMRLAEHLEMERTTLYRALALLEKSGLVECVPVDGGVSKAVRLTRRGRSVTARAQARWKELHDSFLDRFGPGGLEHLNGLLATVRAHFNSSKTKA